MERESDLNLVNSALKGAESGHGALVVVRGPLGIGKSALLESIGELGARMGALILRANAAAMEHDFCFGVVRQLVEPALSRASAVEDERWRAGYACHAREVLADDALTAHEHPLPDADLETAFHGLSTLVDNMSGDRLVLVLVDDLQWSDNESLRWLKHLVGRTANNRVVVVCTLLDGEVGTAQPLLRELLSQAEHIATPARLSVEAVRTIVQRHYEATADDEFVTACHELSGGNPLFLTSILGEATFRCLKPTAAYAADLAALRPSLLRQQLLIMLESLPQHIRRAAAAMTILGEGTNPEILGRLAELDAVQRADAIRVLLALGLITDPAAPRFVHPVVQDAFEEGLPLSERAALHVVAAELLHGCGQPVERVADQLMAVVTPQGPWAVQVLRTAADNALRRGRPKAATRYLRRALLDSPPTGPQRARLLVDLATMERSFATAASVRHIAQAVPLLSTTREKAAAMARLGSVVIDPASLQIDEMLQRVTADLTASGLTTGADRELALRLEARLIHMSAWDPGELAACARRLTELGADPSIDTVGERELLAVLIHGAMAANRLTASEAARLSVRLLDREPPSPVHVHTTLPLVLATLTAADSAQGVMAWLDEAYRIAEGREGDVEQAVIRVEQALVALSTGNLTDAKAKIMDARRLSSPRRMVSPPPSPPPWPSWRSSPRSPNSPSGSWAATAWATRHSTCPRCWPPWRAAWRPAGAILGPPWTISSTPGTGWSRSAGSTPYCCPGPRGPP